MAKLSDLSPMLREALCAWQFFRQLGYTAEQIYLGVDGEKLCAQVQWRGLAYNLGVDRTTMTTKQWATIWEHASEVMVAAPKAELDEMWHASKILSLASMVMVSMAESGIFWPDHADFRDLD